MELQPYRLPDGLEAGVDEAGRGAYAGPVFAAAVVLPPDFSLPGLNDSKQVSPARREQLAREIEKISIAYAVASVEVQDIDSINILQASFKAMHGAIEKLSCIPHRLLIDGNRFKPYAGIPHHCEVKGDGRFASIAAASILAKTYRDAYMLLLHQEFPQYGWAKNKGYGTLSHRKAIEHYGLCIHHRKSFAIAPTGLPVLF